MKVEAKKCPCGCKKWLVSPLFYALEATIDKETANELVKRWNHFEEPTAGTAVGTPLYPTARTFEAGAAAVVDRLFHSLKNSTWAEAHETAFHQLKDYKSDMIEDVLKVLKGEL